MSEVIDTYHGDATIKYPVRLEAGDLEAVVSYVVEQERVEVAPGEYVPGLKLWRGEIVSGGRWLIGEARLYLPDGRMGLIVVAGSTVDVTALGSEWAAAVPGAVMFVGEGRAPR